MKWNEKAELCVMLVASFTIAMTRSINARRYTWCGKHLLFFISVVAGLLAGFMFET